MTNKFIAQRLWVARGCTVNFRLLSCHSMRKLYPLGLIVILTAIACNKEYSGWNVYYNSKIALTDVPANENCTTGGVLIQSGLDKNQNNVLDSQEVDQTEMICNGATGTPSGENPQQNSPKQIIIQLDMMTANMTSSTPLVVGSLPFFSKHHYPGYDSIVLVGHPYINPTESNTVTVKLYDLTNNKPIESSTISSSKGYNESPHVMSRNIYSELPDDEISLGISIVSANEGRFAATGALYLYLYRK
jgi:hypothetical protein